MTDYFEELKTAAQAVVDAWDSGDLAAAVRRLDEVLQEIEEWERG